MSLVGVRLTLIHLATIQRETSETDSRGDAGPGTWDDHLTDVPARLYTTSGRETVKDDTVIATDAFGMLVPVDTDVTTGDRVTAVTWRGSDLLESQTQIRAVIRRPDHLQLNLERIA